MGYEIPVTVPEEYIHLEGRQEPASAARRRLFDEAGQWLEGLAWRKDIKRTERAPGAGSWTAEGRRALVGPRGNLTDMPTLRRFD